MNELTIQHMNISDMIKDSVISNIQAEPQDRREILKVAFFQRLVELNANEQVIEQVKKTFKILDKVDKELANEYTRQNAIENSEISLKFDGKGNPMTTIENFLMILRNDKHFSGLRFNLLSYSPEHIVDGKIEKWQDKDDSNARAYIEQNYKIHSREKLDDALRIVFAENEYHPIRQIIESVEWDKKPRIQNLFIKWLKCENTAYAREVTRLVFAGGIHRLYNPGCKFDDVCVLVGTAQGEGKSTFARWLALQDEFFTEVTEMEGQKGIEAIEGAWICEISELLALTKAKEVEAVKSYITKLVDRYRRPFDRRTTDHKRQCIFIGTTNKEQFLTDKTGNRRWYPLKVHSTGYDLFERKDEIRQDIIQCWAEAKALYDKGDLNPYANRDVLEAIRQKQSEAVEDDYREGMIESYLKNREKVCILELWQHALDNQFSKPTRKESNDIVLILQSLGNWVRAEKPERTTEYGIQKIWYNKNFEKDLVSDLPEIDDNF